MPRATKNRGPLLVDKVRGYFDRLPPWLRDLVTIRIEKRKVDAEIMDLDPSALESELRQEVTDERLRTNRYLGDGEPGSGNDMSELPVSHPSEIVITGTGQVADVTETVSATEEHLTEGPPLQDGSSEKVGNVWVTKKVEAPTFDDKTFQLQREDLIPPEFRALVPQKLEAHTIDGNAALPILGVGETLRREEQKKVGVKTVSVQSRDMTSPPVLTGQRIDPQWNGATLDQEQKIVAVGSNITQVFGMTDATIKPIDGVNALQDVWKVNGSFPAITLRNFDEQLQNEVLSEISIAVQGAAYTPSSLVLEYQDRPIDAKHVQRTVNRVDGLPATYSTYTTQMISFPAILSYISFSLVATATANKGLVQWVAGIRAGFSVPALLWTEVSFFDAEPPPFTLYTWKPADIVFHGATYDINLSNVLTDTWSAIGVSYSGDITYGNLVDRFSINATVPSATAYVGAIGSWRVISSEVQRYKRIWMRKQTQVQLL